MLNFSPEQISALDDQQPERFLRSLDEFLREEGLLGPPDPEDPLAEVDRLVHDAVRIGLASELSVTRYAILATQFGPALEALADQPWRSLMRRQGGEEMDPDWIDRVFELVVANLSPAAEGEAA